MTVEPAGASIIYDMSELKYKKARLPPRWFVRLFWIIHHGVYRATKGRFGLWLPKPGGWGAMCLQTIGRRTGRIRPVVVGYFEDGPNLVTMAMNGWGSTEPAWWLNLQAHPDVTVDLVDGPRQVTGERHTVTSALVCGLDGNRSTRTWMPMQRADPWKPRLLFSSRAAAGEKMAVRVASRVEPRMGLAVKIRLKECAWLSR